jgi:hypothetical protein
LVDEVRVERRAYIRKIWLQPDSSAFATKRFCFATDSVAKQKSVVQLEEKISDCRQNEMVELEVRQKSSEITGQVKLGLAGKIPDKSDETNSKVGHKHVMWDKRRFYQLNQM